MSADHIVESLSRLKPHPPTITKVSSFERTRYTLPSGRTRRKRFARRLAAGIRSDSLSFRASDGRGCATRARIR